MPIVETFEEILRVDAVQYEKVTFSNSGRFLACIRQEGTIEVFDLETPNHSDMKKPIPFQLGAIDRNFKPAMLSFSPHDSYLAVSYVNPFGNTSIFKIHEFSNSRTEVWQFNFENPGQHVRQVIWSPNDEHMLMHLSGTNQLHLMHVVKQKAKTDFKSVVENTLTEAQPMFESLYARAKKK